jgi:bla regulator protein BlaR1
MIGNVLAPFLSNAQLALAHHLWQSTVFALAAGLLTLSLRRHPARHRYCLWLAASLKFLVPFSLLMAIGARLDGVLHTTPRDSQAYLVAQQVSRNLLEPSFTTREVRVTDEHVAVIPVLLAVLWLIGFSGVVINRYMRWRKAGAIVRQTVPLRRGREIETLRQIERMVNLRARIRILQSPSPIEPGIFGVRKPVLLWPSEISTHLNDPQLRSILAHEVWHVRRRDNLASAVHMLVEAVFWFHPLVWWLGARMIEERERACDEGAIESGSDRLAYAESILKTWTFCALPSLMCVSGGRGASLKSRIISIVSGKQASRLDFRRKLLLAAAGVSTIVLPMSAGVLQSSHTRQAENKTLQGYAPTSSTIQSTASPSSRIATKKAVKKLCSKSKLAQGQPRNGRSSVHP